MLTFYGFPLARFLKHIQYYTYTAKPARLFSHAMQILNHYHHSFLLKLIVFTVCKHENICKA